jgi:arabinogalactan endo-1,4-beta-galactosidase
MKNSLKILLLFLCLISCSTKNNEVIVSQDEFIRAADMSYLPLIESEGIVYKYNNQPQDALLTLKNVGCNTIRIRVWKNPSDGHSGLTEVKTLALRAKNLGMKIWLTVHYSDTWADPGNQTKPAEWNSYSFSNLRIAVANYTSQILTEINPDIFQIGNETNDGMLWPDGKLSTNETQFLLLVQSASTTIRAQSPNTKIMIHYAGVGSGATWFFNKVSSIDYDYIGLSYYPIYHGKVLADVNTTINSLAQTFNKKVLIAETAYPFTLGYNDYTNNIVGLQSQIIPVYPASNQGQKDYLLAIKNLVKQNANGLGFSYWGSEWVAFRGPTSTNGSPWENQALWDFNNNALPVIDVFSQN